MELASAAIEWIWDAIDGLVSSIIDPIVSASVLYVHDIMFEISKYSFIDGSDTQSKWEEDVTSVFYSSFFISLFAILSVIILTMSIIKYFLAWMAWLLLAIFVVFFVVISLKLFGFSFNVDDVNNNDTQSIDDPITKESIASMLYTMAEPEESGDRISFEDQTMILAIADLLLNIVGLGALIKYTTAKGIPAQFLKVIKIVGSLLLILVSGILLWYSNTIDYSEDSDNIWSAIGADFASIILGIIGTGLACIALLGSITGDKMYFVLAAISGLVGSVGLSYTIVQTDKHYDEVHRLDMHGKLSYSNLDDYWRELHNETN